MADSFRQRLKKGDLLIGTFITLPSPEIAEILADSGFDWLFIDMEHTSLDVQDVQRIVQALEDRFPCLVRVPANDEVWIKGVLDVGPAGLIVPHIHSAEQTTQLLQLSKYPPEGTRSVGISRAQGYGWNLPDYVPGANENLIVIPQVEHIKAVRRVKDIVKVPGVDAVFVGPYDLSGSMGKLGDVSDPEVLEQIRKVMNDCAVAGMPAGIFGVDVESVKPYVELGYNLLAVGSDTLLLGKSARDTLSALGRQS